LIYCVADYRTGLQWDFGVNIETHDAATGLHVKAWFRRLIQRARPADHIVVHG
jgi:hypothetical protein